MNDPDPAKTITRIGLDDPIRATSRANTEGTLCAGCLYFAAECNGAKRTERLTSLGYSCVLKCAGFVEEMLTVEEMTAQCIPNGWKIECDDPLVLVADDYEKSEDDC